MERKWAILGLLAWMGVVATMLIFGVEIGLVVMAIVIVGLLGLGELYYYYTARKEYKRNESEAELTGHLSWGIDHSGKETKRWII